MQAALGQENITQVHLPKELAGRTFRDALMGITERLAAIHNELEQIDRALAVSAQEWRAPLKQWHRAVQNHLAELRARFHISGTTYTFVLEGWLPAAQLGHLRETMAQEVGSQVMVMELPVESSDYQRAPVAFANPRMLQPFELLVRTMALPRYGSFDPTPVLAFFLPLFFGVILGDVAYGAILLTLTLWIQRQYAANAVVRSLAQVLMAGSAWAIVFGFLYGELLGTVGAQFGIRPLWMAREGEQILALFAFALGLGVVHVLLGLLLGVWQAWRERQRSELVAKIGMLIVLTGIFCMVGTVTNLLPAHFFTPSVVVLLLGIVLVSVPSGPLRILLGPLEVLETVGNILSYLRLAAIGLSSVYLALVANQMAGLVGNILVGVVVALLLHSLNSRSVFSAPRSSRCVCTMSSSSGSFIKMGALSIARSGWNNWRQFMELGLVAIGAGLAVGLAALATGYAQARIGSAASGVLAEKRELFGTVMILVAIPETMVILGLAVAAMIIFLLK